MIVGLTVLSLAAVTACGAKKDTAGNNAVGNIEQSTESATVAKAKDIQMQVKDADGNTVTLTGDATINEAGEMVFEGKDSAGKRTFARQCGARDGRSRRNTHHRTDPRRNRRRAPVLYGTSQPEPVHRRLKLSRTL